MELRPIARSSDLVIKEVDGETIVFDLKSDTAKCLNKTSAAVWKLCNGERDALEITNELSSAFEVSVDQNLVWMAFEQLRAGGLLEQEDDLVFMLDERRSLGEDSRESMIPELVFNPVGPG